MKYRTNTNLSDIFFNYLFTSTAKDLPNKLQRARQTLENKITAHIIFQALHECATTISGQQIANPAAAVYLEVFRDVTPVEHQGNNRHDDAEPSPLPTGKKKRKIIAVSDVANNSIPIISGPVVSLATQDGELATIKSTVPSIDIGKKRKQPVPFGEIGGEVFAV